MAGSSNGRFDFNSSLPARLYLLGSVGVIYSGNYQEDEQHKNDQRQRYTHRTRAEAKTTEAYWLVCPIRERSPQWPSQDIGYPEGGDLVKVEHEVCDDGNAKQEDK